MPFVQGCLNHEPVFVEFDTACEHCGEPIRLTIDSRPSCRAEGPDEPLAFVPLVDFTKIEAPSIIDVF